MQVRSRPPRGGSNSASRFCRSLAWLAGLVALVPTLAGQAASSVRDSLSALSLEELMEVEVTTVSKRPEKLTNAPAAVFSLNANDVRRAAVQALPNALRLVPGMQVGRVDSHNWAINARGFADVFANKLLVLQDGRSVYTPLFSGTFWDAQDTLHEDIDRIEVIRGPGSTLWGANAVNGVIDILSKPASETQGSLAAVTAGTEPVISARARYGGAIDGNTHFRVYGKYTEHHPSRAVDGGDAGDAWSMGQAGFRMDRKTAAGHHITVQGDAYRGREDQSYMVPMETPPFVETLPSRSTFEGANLLARLTRNFASGSELRVQGYFDYTGRESAVFGERRRTFDLEAQQRFAAGRQQITVGGGFRTSADRVRNTPTITLTPTRRRLDLWNGYVQDEIGLTPSAKLILGSKFEHNDFTGWETQPGAQLLLTPNDRHTLWTSVMRAVRTPSRAEDDISLLQVTSTPGVFLASTGRRDFGSEDLMAYEAGWRFHARERFSIDVALFVNRYRGLRTSEFDAASVRRLALLSEPLTLSALPVTLRATPANRMNGWSHGGEVALAAQFVEGWRVRAAYSHLEIALETEAGSTDVAGELDEGRSPRDQGYLWSQHDFGRHWQFDAIVRAVGRVPAIAIPGYVTADARLAWRPVEQWEFAIAGRNLLKSDQPEFLPSVIVTQPTRVPRSGTVEIRYAF